MEILLFIVIVSLLFPGSSGSGHFEFMMIPVFIICAALLLAVGAAILYAAICITTWTGGSVGTFELSMFGIIGSLMLGGRAIGVLIDRRKARRAPAVTI